MLAEELVTLVASIQSQKCESGQLELKSAREGCPKLYDTLSSFSNQSGGGIIVFGIDENADYTICGVYDPEALQKRISEQCLEMEPPLRPLCTATEIDGRMVVAAEVQELDLDRRPCFYRGAGRMKGSYVRVGDADRRMTEYEVYSYEAFRKKTQDELRVSERALPEDLDTATFAEFLVRLGKKKPNLAAQPLEKLLRLQGFTEDGKPTLAGVMLFSDYPQACFPRLCIIAVVVPGLAMGDTFDGGERFIDNASIEGTLPQMLEQAIAFVHRNSAVRTIIDPDTGKRNDRTQYPMTAVREIILNALIHRDYSIHTESAPITLTMFNDRFVVENPGGLYGRLTLDTLGSVSADTRNPFIARAMETMEKTENRFSGIPTIRKEMQNYGLPAPVFETEMGVFRVTLYHAAAVTVAPAAPVTVRHGTLEEEILSYCTLPRSRADLSDRFPQFSGIYLMTKFVNPLVTQGLLALSLPEKPKSKHQRFLTRL